MKLAHVSTSQPSAGSARGRRRPNCAGVGRPAVSRASTSAATTSAMSWAKTPPMVIPGGGSSVSKSTPATVATAAIAVAASSAIASVMSMPAKGDHAGHAGRSPRLWAPAIRGGGRSGRTMPSGSSGRGGGEPGCR